MPLSLYEMELFDILLYISSRTEKEYNDKKFENEKNNRNIFNHAQIMFMFIASLMDKKVKQPKYENIFINNKEEDVKLKRKNLLKERVERYSKKNKGVD